MKTTGCLNTGGGAVYSGKNFIYPLLSVLRGSQSYSKRFLF